MQSAEAETRTNNNEQESEVPVERHAPHYGSELARHRAGRVVVVVKSSREIVEQSSLSFPDFLVSVPMARTFPASKRSFRYGLVLPSEQAKVIGEATEVARRLGLRVEVRDLAKGNVFSRLWSRVSGGARGARLPSVTFPGWVIEHLSSEMHPHGLLGSITIAECSGKIGAKYAFTSSNCSASDGSSLANCACA